MTLKALLRLSAALPIPCARGNARPLCVGSARSLCVGERPIIDAVLAGLSEFIDPPMTSRITIAPDERLWIARRVADEVMGRDLPLNFHPAAFRASTNVTPFGAVSVPA